MREKAATKSCCCCSCCVCKFQDHRTPEEQEIVELFLTKRRYGLPDSDGSELSNYLRFIGNHDPLLAILFAHRNNMFGRLKRFMMQACIVGFTLYMNVWSSDGESEQWVGVIISIIILQPTQAILDNLATLEVPCCLWLVRGCADFFFYIIGLGFAVIFWAIGIASLVELSNDSKTRTTLVGNIFLSICVSAAKVQLFDLPNWLVKDWTKIPLFCGFKRDYGFIDLLRCRSGGLLFILGMAVGLPRRTYQDDKEWFAERYNPSVFHVAHPDILVKGEATGLTQDDDVEKMKPQTDSPAPLASDDVAIVVVAAPEAEVGTASELTTTTATATATATAANEATL